MKFPLRYKKIVIHKLTGSFRTSTDLVWENWRDLNYGEVIIRNRFAGCNAIFDTNLCRNGIRYVNVHPPFDMGIESVGEIIAIGEGVTHLRVGEPVATTKLGSGYREYQIAPASRVIKIREAIPSILTLIPTGVSAMVGLERIGEMRGGETLAISAAAGGIGHIVVQLAKLVGCHVVGITGDENKIALLRTLGVDRPINYRRENLSQVLATEYPRGLDIAYDTVGGEIFDAFLDNLAQRGRLVISGHTSDFDKALESLAQPRIYRKLYWKSASVRGFQNQSFPEFFEEAVHRILSLFYRGEIKPIIDAQSFVGLSQAADAVEHILAGGNQGKVVIQI